MHDHGVTRRTFVGGIAAAAAVAPLVPAGARPPATHFLALGDWGRDGTQHQKDVAVQMGRAARATRSRFVLSVGDNFYPDGVKSVTDSQWRTSFEDIYTDPALQVPWHVALGNHDYKSAPQAQLDYAARSRRWRMPRRYYALSSTETGLPDTDMFVIDTTPFVAKYAAEAGAMGSNVRSQDTAAQLRWLDDQLGRSQARNKLVVGHHTILSGGSEHGPTKELVAQVKPLLECHQVRAYINGHDHDMQHIRMAGVDYICCGAGSEVRPVSAVDGTLFSLSRSGFAALEMRDDALLLQFHDYTGKTVYAGPVGERHALAA